MKQEFASGKNESYNYNFQLHKYKLEELFSLQKFMLVFLLLNKIDIYTDFMISFTRKKTLNLQAQRSQI